MGRYAAFGLDDNKRSKDPSKIQKYLFCPWCQGQVNAGLSMCFSNWCICFECVQQGLKHFQNPSTSERIKKEICFKNTSKEQLNCFMSTGEGIEIGVSEDVLRMEFNYMKNKTLVDKKGQTYLHF